MLKPVHDWVMVEILKQHETTKLIRPDSVVNTDPTYCRIADAGPLAKIDESGIKIGQFCLVPRVLHIPGMPDGYGLVKCGDIFFVMDELPATPEPTTIETVLAQPLLDLEVHP